MVKTVVKNLVKLLESVEEVYPGKYSALCGSIRSKLERYDKYKQQLKNLKIEPSTTIGDIYAPHDKFMTVGGKHLDKVKRSSSKRKK